MIAPSKVTQEMLEELDEFLMSDDATEDSMQLSELDGFLAGIVAGPELIMPSEWTPVIWMDGEPKVTNSILSITYSAFLMNHKP